MKSRTFTAVLIASFLISSNAFAQSSTSPVTAGAPATTKPDVPSLDLGQAPPLVEGVPADWKARYDSARRLKRTGILLVIGGLAAIVGGIVLGMAGENDYTTCWNTNAIHYDSRAANACTNPYENAAVGLAVGGTLRTMAGVPLWIVGAVKMHSAGAEGNSARSTGQSWMFPVADHQAITFTARDGAAVGYRLSW